MIEALSGVIRDKRLFIRRFAVFGVLGVVVNLIYVSVFSFLNYADSGQRLLWATIAYGLACAFQYVANAIFTFGKKVADPMQFLKYCASVFFGYLFSTFLIVYIGPVLKLPDILAMAVIIVSLAAFNYLFFSRWVYGCPMGHRR